MTHIPKVILAFLIFSLCACEYTEVTHETGYKGKARLNPWLAAERFVARQELEVRSLPTWESPAENDSVWFVPAGILSNESFNRQMEHWVSEGGHLVLLLEHANAEADDWQIGEEEPIPAPALDSLLERVGIQLKVGDEEDGRTKATGISFEGIAFEVDAESAASVAADGGKPGVFATMQNGEGRVTVVTDGRLFRNRWIGEKDHAALLQALVDAADVDGPVVFLRGSGLSVWSLLVDHLWPILLASGACAMLWLWKNFSRFGPLEAAVLPSPLRGYDHHLEALGDYQWRLDRGTALLAPLRSQIVELGKSKHDPTGKSDPDFSRYLADRSGIPLERVSRALADGAPADASTFTRTAVDLQQLLQALH